MKKKIYMTKKRKQQLHMALSINDLLYRKFDQMQKHINDYARHLEKTYKNVIQVTRKKGNINYREQIIDVQKIEGEGLLIIIK